MRIIFSLAGVLALFLLGVQTWAATTAKVGEWPAWRGADRTGISQETGLLKEWPAGGPKLLWTAKDLGDGWSTPSIAGGHIYLMGTIDKQEVVLCLDAASGERVWASQSLGKMEGGYPAPRSTPTTDRDLLYVISSSGKLAALDIKNGDLRWSKEFKKEFGGRSGGWAYTESPLIDGDVLVCTPGGEKSFMVALNKLTGDQIWAASSEGFSDNKNFTKAGYSSAIVADVCGERQYIQFVNGGVVGVSAKEGKPRWHYDHPANTTANCSTPIFKDNIVFAASAYSTGGGAAEITRSGDDFKATELYFVKEIQNHHGGVLLIDGKLYGTGGQSLLCIDFKTGKIEWQNRSVGKGSVAYADGRLVVRGENEKNGEIALVEASPAGYKETGRFYQPERSGNKCWPHPVIAGGRLYIRDWDKLFCYDIQAK